MLLRSAAAWHTVPGARALYLRCRARPGCICMFITAGPMMKLCAKSTLANRSPPWTPLNTSARGTHARSAVGRASARTSARGGCARSAGVRASVRTSASGADARSAGQRESASTSARGAHARSAAGRRMSGKERQRVCVCDRACSSACACRCAFLPLCVLLRV